MDSSNIEARLLEYQSLLAREEWKARREQIIVRDQRRCNHCHITSNLHVHHRYYILGRDPWEYPDDALVALCEACHSNVHKASSVPYFLELNGDTFILQFDTCTKCNGAGWFPHWSHIDDGVCFQCHGTRYDVRKISSSMVLNPKDVENAIKAATADPQVATKSTTGAEIPF